MPSTEVLDYCKNPTAQGTSTLLFNDKTEECLLIEVEILRLAQIQVDNNHDKYVTDNNAREVCTAEILPLYHRNLNLTQLVRYTQAVTWQCTMKISNCNKCIGWLTQLYLWSHLRTGKMLLTS